MSELKKENMRVIGAMPPLPGLDVDYCDWNAATETADLSVLEWD